MRAGQHGHKRHQPFLTQLTLTHIQLDELWAPVKHAEPAPWVWVACDAKTKLIPVLQLGPRTQAMAFAVVHELLTRLKPGPLPAFSSDGLRHYFYALTAHCGAWVQATPAHKPIWTLATDFLYAQVIKHRRRQRLISVSPRLVWGQVADYVARLTRAGLRGRINTAFVERINLTLR